MFRIGEFSKLTQVTIRMLRYYDEMELLKPAQVDKLTGYRMYSTEQIPVLNKIIYLRDSGFSVAEIATALKNEDDQFTEKQLECKYKEIELNIREEQEKLKKIELARRELQGSGNRMHYNVLIKEVPAYQVLSLRRIIPTYYEEGRLWQEMSDYAERNNISISNDTFTIYHDSEYKERDVDVELCVPVKRMGKNSDGFAYCITNPILLVASTMVYGAFSNIAGAYLALAKWLQENGQYRMSGNNRQIVHRGPWNEDNEEKYLTEIQIPLENLSLNP